MAKDIYVGVDLGGTKVYACPVQPGKKFKVLAESKNETLASEGQEAVVKRIVQTIEQSIRRAELSPKKVRAVGIGVPGTVDVKKGQILFASNLKWENVPIKKILEKKLGIPVFADNDVNLGTLGEQKYGAARNVDNVFGVYWGTGIGGGLITGGRIVHGYTFTAGEIGHMVLSSEGGRCGCGNKGCLETISAKWAISTAIKQKIQSGQESEVLTKEGQVPDLLKSRVIRQGWINKDPVFRETLNQAIEYLGMALANIVNVFNPQMIVLGGGVIEAMEDELLPLIEEALHRHTVPFAAVQLRAAELGDFSVLAGAARFARQQVKKTGH